MSTSWGLEGSPSEFRRRPHTTILRLVSGPRSRSSAPQTSSAGAPPGAVHLLRDVGGDYLPLLPDPAVELARLVRATAVSSLRSGDTSTTTFQLGFEETSSKPTSFLAGRTSRWLTLEAPSVGVRHQLDESQEFQKLESLRDRLDEAETAREHVFFRPVHSNWAVVQFSKADAAKGRQRFSDCFCLCSERVRFVAWVQTAPQTYQAWFTTPGRLGGASETEEPALLSVLRERFTTKKKLVPPQEELQHLNKRAAPTSACSTMLRGGNGTPCSSCTSETRRAAAEKTHTVVGPGGATKTRAPGALNPWRGAGLHGRGRGWRVRVLWTADEEEPAARWDSDGGRGAQSGRTATAEEPAARWDSGGGRAAQSGRTATAEDLGEERGHDSSVSVSGSRTATAEELAAQVGFRLVSKARFGCFLEG